MNKFIKFLGYMGVHLLVMIEVWFLAILLASPIVGLVFGIMDATQHVPAILEGRFFIAWLIITLVLWLPMYIYVEIKGHRDRHLKEEKK